MTPVWCAFQLRSADQIRPTVLSALEQVGVHALEHSPAAARPTAGLIFFDELTDRLCDFIRDISENGIGRILAIWMSRDGAAATSWALLGAGASDVFAGDSFGIPAAAIAARLQRWEAVDRLIDAVQQRLIGKSRAWTAVLRQIVEIARFSSASVLITGETGTGKELIARLIHELDDRPDKGEFVIVDCTTVVPELAGSEFFGHERGAFTGAVNGREGAFALADRGTLFIDEIPELPLTLQAELLRVIQEHSYKRVGSNTWKRTEFRLICATNRDLLELEEIGRFRRDLYYRIASWTCRLPPLRERSDDILPLARHFIAQATRSANSADLDDPVRSYLISREYRGNVRDLKQLVLRILYRHVGNGPITVGDIPEQERPAGAWTSSEWHDQSFEAALRRALSHGCGLREIGRITTETAIRLALENEEGSLPRAARRLGVTDRALQLRRAAWRLRPAQAQIVDS